MLSRWEGEVPSDHGLSVILAHRDSIRGGTTIPVPASARYAPAGFYMDSYKVSFDRAAGEYHVALTGLAWKK